MVFVLVHGGIRELNNIKLLLSLISCPCKCKNARVNGRYTIRSILDMSVEVDRFEYDEMIGVR